MLRSSLLLACSILALAGCGGGPEIGLPDAGPLPEVDAGTPPEVDAGTPPEVDAGTPPEVDAGGPPEVDAGTPPEVDAGGLDAGTPPAVDAGTPDAGAPDAGTPDGGARPDGGVGCAPNPCRNGGACTEVGGGFQCSCPIAFTGATCADAAPSGLAARPRNPSCVAFDRPASSGTLAWVRRGTAGLNGLNLMTRRQAPSGHWYEIYRTGQIHVIDPSGNRAGSPLATVSVNTDGELGLLGLALHPGFQTSPFLYVYYARFSAGPGSNVEVLIDRFRVDNAATAPSINASSRRNIFTFNRGGTATNHVGGTIEFDPLASTPTLYLGTGDGGTQWTACRLANPAGSANGNCQPQYATSLHGKMLRFDVSNTSASATYTPEVVAMGLRNPFRWSFDPVTGDLWIGDVGQDLWEEVSVLPRARLPGAGGTPVNFGWPCFEGFDTFASGTACSALQGALPPVHVYGRSLGVSVIGGRVYRGTAIADLAGTYLFNDIFPRNNGAPWRLDPNPSQSPADPRDDYLRTDIGDSTSPRSFVSYAEDNDGELWAFQQFGGTFRLEVASPGGPAGTVPATLSASGCFAVGGAPTASLIPYEPRAPLWSDGSSKRRWLAIPDGTTITLGADGDFVFPAGTVLAKEFTQGGVRIETRLFVLHDDGQWAGYTYSWADANGNAVNDAVLVGSGSVTRPVPGTALDWQFPSRGQCMTCHTEQAGFSLGLEVAQLNGELTYPSGTRANQLHTLQRIGVLTGNLGRYLARDRLPTYGDVSVPVAERAHAYLHSNCSSCHRVGASGFGGRSSMPDIAYRLGATNDLRALLCGVRASADHLGLGMGARLVEPGRPGSWSNLGAGGSVLYLRMAARETVPGSSGAMPPIATRAVDPVDGLPLVADFINQLTCP